MRLEDVKDYLEQRLTESLPGLEAQNLMSARMKNSDRMRFKREDEPKKGAVMILLYQDADAIRFPLIQRPEYPGVHSGQMALPGGKREAMETDIETALRETEEEIGIPQGQISVIGELTSFYVFVSNFQIQPVIGFLKEVPKFIAQEAEVSEIVSARLDHLLHDDFAKEKIIRPHETVALEAPYFDLENKVVWGATAMMLNELKVILKDRF